MGSGTRRSAILAAWPPGRSGGVAGGEPRAAGGPAAGVAGWASRGRAVLFVLFSDRRCRRRPEAAPAAGGRGGSSAGSEQPDVTAEDVEAAVEYGREGLMDLFRILGTAESSRLRDAAGRALAVLWARDDLIAEEEKALVRRGFAVDLARPPPLPPGPAGGDPDRGRLRRPVPPRRTAAGIAPDEPGVVAPILGARRAALETPSPWKAGPGPAEFALVPGDFETDGPHRLVLQARVRTVGLTDSWELELPQMPVSASSSTRTSSVDALLTLADDARAEAIARRGPARAPRARTRPDRPPSSTSNDDAGPPRPARLAVTTPLPCDLAHAIELEFEGVAGRFAAGAVDPQRPGARAARRARRRSGRSPSARSPRCPPTRIDRPGRRRIRAILTADPDRGWADPDVRSIWPGRSSTDWVEVQVVRR